MNHEPMSYDEEQALKHIAPLGEDDVQLFSFKRLTPMTLEVCFKHRDTGEIERQVVGIQAEAIARPTLTQEQIKQLIDTLAFYGEGKNYEWDGCHCHGRWKREEFGDMAKECLNFLHPLTYCHDCNEPLFDDGTCTDVTCKNYNWEKHP